MFHQGIVEDNNDPLKLGRVRIRIFGLHTENKSTEDDNQYLPIEDLPWAEAAFPINSPSISGEGDFLVPRHGSFVWLFFKDESNKQYPVYFATTPKIEKSVDGSNGFTDPDGDYPTGNYNDISGVNRLAQGIETDQTIIDSKTSGIENSALFSEPATPYAAEYPNNRVISTKNHVIELDDTEGSERIHIYHLSGTFDEYHPSGDKVEKVQGSKFVITLQDNNVYVKGNGNLHVAGNQTVQIDGNENVTVGGNSSLTVVGNSVINATGNIQATSLGSTQITATADVTITSAVAVNLISTAVVTIKATAGCIIDGGSGALAGVITGLSTCHFTGLPHADPSATTICSK